MSLHDSRERRVAACPCHAPAEAGEPDGMRDANAVRLSRRGVLRASLTGTAASVLAGAGLGGFLLPTAGCAQSPPRPEDAPCPKPPEDALDPEKALQELMAGNKRFIEQRQRLMDGDKRFIERRLNFSDEDLAILRENKVPKHNPFASVLSCADARVPVELLFDQGISHVFVNRVAGNIATSEIIASIEYGVAVLRTPLLMVLGHSCCGAVEAAILANDQPGQISALYRYIRPAVDETRGDNLVATIKANAKIQAKLLSESSPVIAEALEDEKLTVVAAYYDLASGEVSLLG